MLKSTIVVRIVLVVVIVALSVTLISMLVDISERNKQNAELEEKTKEQNMHNEEMRELLSTDNVADFMREIAESLGFVNSGDTVYRAPDAGK